MFGSDFLLSGGKGGLGFSSSSKTGSTSSGGTWNGNVNYADKTATAGSLFAVIIVVGSFLFYLFKKG